MRAADAFGTAAGALRANPLRSALTTLGVIIGVAAVVAMVAAGRGAESQIESALRGIGTNILVVGNGTRTADGQRQAQGTLLSLTEDDAAAIARQIPDVLVSAPSVGGTLQVVAEGRNWFTKLRGVTPDYFIARNWTIGEGRDMTPEEVRDAARVAIVGETIVEEIFDGLSPVGRTLRVNRVPFTVIGVMEPKGQAPWGEDQDDIVFAPIRTAKMRVLGDRQSRSDLVGQITVKVHTPEALGAVEAAIVPILRERHHLRPGEPDDFFVSNLTEVLSARAEFSRTMSALLASIAAISLVVGGIGIMNIMLVAVSERRREIGLRMAMGATRRAIMVQFTLEALILSLMGGAVGVVAGIAGSELVSHLAGWPVLVGPEAVVIAVVFSALVGLFFGYYPARKAAALDPIEALRQE